MADVEDAQLKRLQRTVFFVTRIGDDDTDVRKRSNDLMELLLEPAIKEFDDTLTVVRADTQAPVGTITEKIFHHLVHSAYVIADTTGNNPNVAYEVGVAHAFQRPVLLIVDDANKIPFDLKVEAHLAIPGVGAMGARVLRDAKDRLLEGLRELKALVEAQTPLGPVAAAEGRLTPPDISGEEATALLREAIGDLTDRVRFLEMQGDTISFSDFWSRPAPEVVTAADQRAQVGRLASAGARIAMATGGKPRAVIEDDRCRLILQRPDGKDYEVLLSLPTAVVDLILLGNTLGLADDLLKSVVTQYQSETGPGDGWKANLTK